jgi:hypothetical protein
MTDINQDDDEKVPDISEAGYILSEHLAKYLYENYETDAPPSRDPKAGIGDTQTWEELGSRRRQYWFDEATKLTIHMSKAFSEL